MPDWQLILVGLIVAVAGAFLVKSAWQTLRGKPGRCGGRCACPSRDPLAQPAKTEALIPPQQLTLRRHHRDTP